MTFKPKFPSFRGRLIGFAIAAAFYGTVAFLAGHDYCHRGKDAMAIAAILSMAAAVPESPAKPKPEDYGFTERSKP